MSTELYLEYVKRKEGEWSAKGTINLASSGIAGTKQLFLENYPKDNAHLLKLITSKEPHGWGHPGLIQAIRERYYDGRDLVILPTSGSSTAIPVAYRGLCPDGGRALIERPTYEPLIVAAQQLGLHLEWLQRSEDTFGINPDHLTHQLQRYPDFRLLVLTRPHNPTGALLSDQELLHLHQVARRIHPELITLVDETYLDPALMNAAPAVLLGSGLVSVSSLSKIEGLGALIRCGWIAAEQSYLADLRRSFAGLQNVTSLYEQELGRHVLEHIDIYRNHAKSFLSQNHRALLAHDNVQSILKCSHLPPFACTFFPKISRSDTQPFVDHLEREHNVAVIPGRFFSAPGHIRIALGVEPSQFTEGLDRLLAAIATGRTSGLLSSDLP